MTIHSSKGLEFPVVFVPGLSENFFPARKAEDERQLEEEKEAKYNSYKALNNNYKNSSVNNEKSNQKSALIELKNMKWYKKIWKSIKNFLRI